LSAKVFVDTSALFSGIRSPSGYARDLLYAGSDGGADLIASPVVVDEARRNLLRKGTPVDISYLERLIRRGVLHLSGPEPEMVLAVARVVEFKDAPIVAGAIAAEAPMLATYDRRHLLSQADVIREAFGVEVLTPEDVLRRLADAAEQPPK